jgi:hypothetical protein
MEAISVLWCAVAKRHACLCRQHVAQAQVLQNMVASQQSPSLSIANQGGCIIFMRVRFGKAWEIDLPVRQLVGPLLIQPPSAVTQHSEHAAR